MEDNFTKISTAVKGPWASDHGGDLLAFAERYRRREDEIIDFSSNVNPLPMPPSIRDAYLDAIHELPRYPDSYAQALCEKIGDYFSVSGNYVMAGNGSLAILDLAVRVLAPKRALIVEPCFSEYRRLLELYGAKVDRLLLRKKNSFKFSLGQILASMAGMDLVLLGHPNNPTGTALSKEKLCTLIEKASWKGTFVVVDEAFCDWVPHISVVDQVRSSKNVLVVRSFTKFFALAGIRIGFGIGPTRVIDLMKKNQGPWTCNRIAQKVSLAALSDVAFQTESRHWLRDERAWLKAELRRLRIFNVFPGLANFLWVKSRKPLTSFFDFLGYRGIYVRQAVGFSINYNAYRNTYFRISVRTRSENEQLIKVLGEWAGTGVCLKEKSVSIGTNFMKILSAYGMKPMGAAREVKHNVWKVTTDLGEVIVKVPCFRTTEVELKTTQDFTDYLKAQSVPAVSAMRNRDGRLVTYMNDKCHTLYPFVEGCPGRLGFLDAYKLKSTAHFMARFHNLAHKFHAHSAHNTFHQKPPLLRSDHVENEIMFLDGIERLYARGRAPKTEMSLLIHANAEFIKEQLKKLEQSFPVNVCDKLPKHIIHGDFHPGNVLFRENKVVGVLDWEFSRIDARMVDVANGMTHGFEQKEGAIDMERIWLFTSEYQKSVEEKLLFEELLLLPKFYQRLYLMEVIYAAKFYLDAGQEKACVVKRYLDSLKHLDHLDWSHFLSLAAQENQLCEVLNV